MNRRRRTNTRAVPIATQREVATKMMQPAVVTFAHAGRLLGVTRGRARQLVDESELVATVVAGRRYVMKSSLDALIARRSKL